MFTCRERREQGAVRRWGQQRVGVRLRRNPGRHRSYSTSQSGQAVSVRQETERGNASLTSQTTHSHTHMYTHTRIHAHTCTIHTYAHAHVHPRGHIGIHSLTGVHSHQGAHIHSPVCTDTEAHTSTHWCACTPKQTQRLSPRNASHSNSTFVGETIRSSRSLR